LLADLFDNTLEPAAAAMTNSTMTAPPTMARFRIN